MKPNPITETTLRRIMKRHNISDFVSAQGGDIADARYCGFDVPQSIEAFAVIADEHGAASWVYAYAWCVGGQWCIQYRKDVDARRNRAWFRLTITMRDMMRFLSENGPFSISNDAVTRKAFNRLLVLGLVRYPVDKFGNIVLSMGEITRNGLAIIPPSL